MTSSARCPSFGCTEYAAKEHRESAVCSTAATQAHSQKTSSQKHMRPWYSEQLYDRFQMITLMSPDTCLATVSLRGILTAGPNTR